MINLNNYNFEFMQLVLTSYCLFDAGFSLQWLLINAVARTLNLSLHVTGNSCDII